jgi:ribosomal protein S18 acetylase RimI-like enzyme
MLKKHLVEHTYPFTVTVQMGSIEFVATSPEHRGKGAARGLIDYIINNTYYSEYVLEVADNNTTAVKLYEKLGFAEFMRTPAPKGSGVDYFVYMTKGGVKN